MGHYKDEHEIEAEVAGFEQCTTEKDKFTHLSHLTVAVYYLRQSTLTRHFRGCVPAFPFPRLSRRRPRQV